MKILIKGGYALLFDGHTFDVKEKDIFIDGKLIAGVFDPESEDIPKDADRVIDAKDRLVIPGLINAHTHAYMSLFRNFADDMDFWDWLEHVQNVEEHITEEDCYWGTLLNCIEMIQTGTTCFVDMNIKSAKKGRICGPESASAGAAAESGMRAVITRGLSGTADSEESLMKFAQTVDEMDTFRDNDRIKFWFGPHAPYSCMADYLVKLKDAAKERGCGITIHLSESEGEVAGMLEEKKVTPIKYTADLGVFEVPVIAAHCVQATEDDLRLFREKNVSVAINPKSNMKLGNGFAPVQEMLDAGVNVCIGTDGSGSNNTQNLFAEMNTAALVYKGKAKKAVCVSAQDVLKMATVGGAKAIGMEDETGIIKEGAKADLAILDISGPEFYPRNNTVHALVYSATGAETETVIVDGEVIMENRRLLTIDEKKVYEECERIARRLNMQE